MNELDKIVKICLEQHIGGENFFDHLDKAVQTEPIIKQLYDKFKSETVNGNNIIVSGKFGNFFSNWIKTQENSSIVITVNGGLRKGDSIDDLSYLRPYIKNQDFIFLDDSFYSGKTRNAVKTEIERLGGRLLHTFVVYDGSKRGDQNVKSLYRYYR